MKMRKLSAKKTICNWLGIFAIVIQAFMPVWQANAETGDSETGVSGFSEICYALTEAVRSTSDNEAPFGQTDASSHCLLCQLPSFGNVLPDVTFDATIPYDHVVLLYFPAQQQTWSQSTHQDRPPSHAPPV